MPPIPRWAGSHFQIPSTSNVPPRYEFVLIAIVIIMDIDQTLNICQVYIKGLRVFFSIGHYTATSSAYYYYLHFIKRGHWEMHILPTITKLWSGGIRLQPTSGWPEFKPFTIIFYYFPWTSDHLVLVPIPWVMMSLLLEWSSFKY